MSSEHDAPIPPAALERLPLFPLPSTVLFPGVDLLLHVFEPRYRDMVEWAVNTHRYIGVALLQPGFEQDYDREPVIHPVVGMGRLMAEERLADGRWNIYLRGVDRARIEAELDSDHAFRVARAALLPSHPPPQNSAQLQQILRGLVARLAAAVPEVQGAIQRLLDGGYEGPAFADMVASRVIPSAQIRQSLLEIPEPLPRMHRVIDELTEILVQLDPSFVETQGLPN